MGSYRSAIMTGFLCRLCSMYKDVVLHLYGRRARDLSLLEKMKILPVSIKKYDKLPKTVCESCVEKLCSQYEYIQQIRRNLEIRVNHQRNRNGCPSDCVIHGVSSNASATRNSTAATACISNSSPPRRVNELGEDMPHSIRVMLINQINENNTDSDDGTVS